MATERPDWLLDEAASWLYSGESDNSIMAHHALGMASKALEEAAVVLPVPLAQWARSLARECDEAGSTAGAPQFDGLWKIVSALRDAVLADQSQPMAAE